MTEQPPEWVFKKLDEIADVIRGVTYSAKDVVAEGTPDSLMLLRATNIQDGKLDNLDPVYIPSKLVKSHQFLLPGDIVMASSSGSIQIVGKNALVRERIAATFGAFCTVIRAREVDSTFLFYFLQSPVLRQQWSDLARGSNINNLKTTDTASTIVPVPPVDEQKRIVETLDWQFQKLERAKEETKDAALGAKRFASSLLHAMFTGDLMRRELGIEDSNRIELSSVAEVQSGGTPKGLERLTSESSTDTHTVPFYKVGDMNRDSRYMDSSRSYLDPDEVAKLRLKVIPEGSVVFPKAGGAIATDKKRLVRVPGPIDLNCMAVIPSAQLLPAYLAWWFESFKLSDLANGSILPQIGKTAVMQVQLPSPSLVEQTSVVEYLEENISRVRAQASEIENLSHSIETLRRSILNNAFSGQSSQEN